jgi:hypothetical protein
MIHFMLATLSAARLTDFSTYAANLMCELRSAAHECRCTPAGLSTIAIEPDAIRHLGHVAFLKACIGAMLARLGTLDTGRDAALKFVMSHFCPLCELPTK